MMPAGPGSPPLEEAVADYEAALALDPLNKAIAKDLQRIRRTLAARVPPSEAEAAEPAAEPARADEQTD